MKPTHEASIEDICRKIQAMIEDFMRIQDLAPSVLTGRQYHLMLRGKARVRKKWRNEVRRRLEKKSGS